MLHTKIHICNTITNIRKYINITTIVQIANNWDIWVEFAETSEGV